MLWVAIFETAVIMWVYGVNNFSRNLHFMLDHKMNILLKIFWVLTPIILAVIFGIACWYWTEPTYGNGAILYSEWAHLVGWFLTLFVALQIPGETGDIGSV